MREYRLLLGLALRNCMASFRAGSWKREGGKLDRGRIASTVVMVLCMGIMAAFIIFVEVTLFKALKLVGQPALLPAMAMLMSMMSTLLLGFFHVMSGLYFSRDTVWMAYLPVRSRTVLAAKMTEIWLGEELFCAAVVLPGFILYGTYLKADALYYLRMVLVVLLTPVLPLYSAALLTTLLARLTSVSRNKETWAMAGSVLLLAGVLALEMTVLPKIPDDADVMYFAGLLLSKEGLLNMLAGAFPPVLWAVHGMNGSAGEFLLFVGVCAAAAALMMVLLGRVYLPICLRQTEQGVRRRHGARKAVQWKQRRPLWALVGREWNEIIKTPAYAFNCLSGVIIFPLIAGMMYMTLSSQGEMGEAMTALMEIVRMGSPLDITLVLAAAMAFGCFMNPAVATAVSREGHRLEISRMLPVTAGVQLAAKLIMGMMIDVITVGVAAVLVAAVMPQLIAMLIPAVVLALMASFAISAMNLTLDAIRPNLHWVNETQVIKQSANVAFGMLIGIVLFALPVVCAVLLHGAGAVNRMLAVVAVLAVECLAGWLLVKHVAARRYAALEASD